MFKAVKVTALSDYRLEVEYSDGCKGVVDLSYLVGKGVFKKWEDEQFFDQVQIGEKGDIRWNDTIDLCPDSIYLKIMGKSPEELFPSLKLEKADA